MTSNAAIENVFAELLEPKRATPAASGGARQPLTDAVLIEQLISSTRSTFATMCGMQVAMDGSARRGCPVNYFELSGVVGIVGAVRATVAISLPRRLAFQVVETLTGSCPTDIDADVIDSVGELANIIAGATKRGLHDGGLSDRQLALEIPTVIFGPGHRVAFSANMNLYVLPFLSDFGAFQVEIGIDTRQ
ncbi:MAG: chemotaxis protein CheX, partial [Aureliella sp.]